MNEQLQKLITQINDGLESNKYGFLVERYYNFEDPRYRQYERSLSTGSNSTAYSEVTAASSGRSNNADNDLAEFHKIAVHVNRYIKYFRENGTKTTSAFLSLAGITKDEFDLIATQFDKRFSEVHKVLEEGYDSWASVYQLELSDRLELISDIRLLSGAILEFARVNGKVIDILDGLDLGYDSDFVQEGIKNELRKEVVDQLDPSISDFLSRPEVDGLIEKEVNSKYSDVLQGLSHRKSTLFGNDKDLSVLKDLVAIEAGKIIYQSLVHATIDLAESGAKNGDVLKVKVIWYNRKGDGTDNDVANGVELATARFILKKTGWRLKVSDSAMLIDRIAEHKLRDDYPLSPSNFKPTAGAAMMWTYHTDKRGNGWLRSAKWLEPSIGFNVTYLDFDRTKDFELGFGPVIGLWRNAIFVTGGYNFMVGGESPFYWGVGFSFTNIAMHVKEIVTTKD